MSSNPVVQPTSDSQPSPSNSQSSQEAPKKKRVVIGLPGDHFSQAFILSWTDTLVSLLNAGRYEIVVSTGKSSFVSFARMQTLGLDVLRGKNQKPFNGMEYDVFVSIDSDVVFSPVQLVELIESTAIHPVVSGYYMMSNNKQFAVVKEWNKEFFLKNGTFEFVQPKDFEPHMKKFSEELAERRRAEEAKEEVKPLSAPEFISVSYVGMGFFACRREVLDALQYPYFNRELQRMRTKDGLELVDMCSEDVALCKNIEDAGFDIMVNTRLRVGHEKNVIL
jgi:hypothetical protein